MLLSFLYYKRSWLWMVIIFSCISCGPSNRGLFGKKTPHEKYKKSLEDAGLYGTRLGALWAQAADKSLTRPISVTIPYKETGYFEMDTPSAAGYIFSAKRGEMVNVNVETNPANGFLLFIELWERIVNDEPEFLTGANAEERNIQYEIKQDGEYIIRLQPELLQAMAYTITITTGPSLAYPVNKKDNPRILSFWGAPRDGNSRSHEGIDILAPKYTPAVAVAEGFVTRVSENNLGGRVVFLRPTGKNYSLYYAHLDTQLVRSGERVNVGDTIGLIGNTGNAQSTPAHLHFGIYTSGGAIDPLPFVNTNRPPIRTVKADTGFITKHVRMKNTTTLYMGSSTASVQKETINQGAIAKVLGATDDLYKIQLPSDEEGFIKSAFVTIQPLLKETITESKPLLDSPGSNTPIKKQLMTGSTITVIGTFGDYYFVESENIRGWIKK